MALQIVTLCLIQLLSIGCSDSIELFFNPQVHKIHNCPDIIKKSFEDYNHIDAFISGLLCAWLFIFIECIVLLLIYKYTNMHLNWKPLLYVSIINVLLPIFVNDKIFYDIFLCHKILYLINILAFMCIII